jgi:hypothetical protein
VDRAIDEDDGDRRRLLASLVRAAEPLNLAWDAPPSNLASERRRIGVAKLRRAGRTRKRHLYGPGASPRLRTRRPAPYRGRRGVRPLDGLTGAAQTPLASALLTPRLPTEWPFIETAIELVRGQLAILREDWRTAEAALEETVRTPATSH